MDSIKTVSGWVHPSEINTCLSHEHICCYSEYLCIMAGEKYLNKEEIENKSVAELTKLKETYGMNLFVDCTPVNIGRDVDLLKRVSQKSGVHIVCSTGFYYTDEPVLHNTNENILAQYIAYDAGKVNAGLIKAAVENENISVFNQKMLNATALAHCKTGLPIVLHTNAHNKNGLESLAILLKNGVPPECITVGHLSDTDDIEYVLEIAKSGCYIGLDRLINDTSEEYINKKLKMITTLSQCGFENKIILSHDELVFNGFGSEFKPKKETRYDFVFKYILPGLGKDLANRIISENPLKMLMCVK